MKRPRGQSEKRSKTLGLISLGCPKNTVDSERLLGELGALGWEFTSEISDADCLVVNTCGFIRDARLESEEAIAEICEARASHPGVILVATGCLPQRIPGVLGEKFPELDLVVGAGDLAALPAMIEALWNNEETSRKESTGFCQPGRATLSMSTDPRLRISPPWTAYMKIAEGCSLECSFCTIPSIKGPHISRPIDDLVKEAENLAQEGVKELILISQDTTAYGSDIGTNLRRLLQELDGVDGIRWIRLHYLYPGKISDGLLDTIAESRHVIPYFDIPLQHVSPKILRSMKRLDPDMNPLDLVKKIRARFESAPLPACLRTTFITGFPGETEDDFRQMPEFIESAMLDRVTVFQYSREDGTPAASLPDEVPEHVAEARMHRLMETQQEISLDVNEGWIGKTIEVLLEGETDEGRRAGRSYRDAPEIDGLVLVDGVPENMDDGSFISVRIDEAMPYDLAGEPV
jgi:ribosomal protein S12 methylthiotransferase